MDNKDIGKVKGKTVRELRKNMMNGKVNPMCRDTQCLFILLGKYFENNLGFYQEKNFEGSACIKRVPLLKSNRDYNK